MVEVVVSVDVVDMVVVVEMVVEVVVEIVVVDMVAVVVFVDVVVEELVGLLPHLITGGTCHVDVGGGGQVTRSGIFSLNHVDAWETFE